MLDWIFLAIQSKFSFKIWTIKIYIAAKIFVSACPEITNDIAKDLLMLKTSRKLPQTKRMQQNTV